MVPMNKQTIYFSFLYGNEKEKKLVLYNILVILGKKKKT